MSEVSKVFRLGMVGVRLNSISTEHIRNILQVPGLHIVAICDIRPVCLEQVQAEQIPHEVAAYTDYERMLSDAEKLELDAVVVSTPKMLRIAMIKRMSSATPMDEAV